ncbi:ATP-binding cassette domain-containing protein [Paenibacillus sp. L3-i20]|uniref:ATP-binding cassette domain-containing protein n=1 Tax=Paenibacillus sp. L3-i20 TaxID=2905833 RepID=UPI001EDF4075|nr:ATP-binding cassette domain-containing protein [Paenibacillus sp. L3-i20]GKU78715.1 hypothetical protein L3i20_v231120 [Paenibacillus sp. L3-i20]
MAANWQLNSVCVTAGIEDEVTLLQDVDLTFQSGKITLLIGHNGAGKSTLLETMAGLRLLQSGEVMLGAASIWQEGKRSGRKKRTKQKRNVDVLMKLGISLQQSESQWFAATVREELAFSLRPYKLTTEESEKRMNAALKEVGLPSSLLAHDPWTLSGGQQRRLSMACLLACEPDWLLLDEPTAGLDAVGTRRLCAVLAAHRAAGRGAVVATHDLDALLPLADAVVVLDGGRAREAAPEAAALSLAAAAPQALRAVALLREQAALPAAGLELAGGAIWPSPKELAAALQAAMRSESPSKTTDKGIPSQIERTDIAVSDHKKNERSARVHLHAVVQQNRNENTNTPNKMKQKRHFLRPDYFDPRAIVLAYLLLTAGILMLTNLSQIAWGALIVAAVSAPFWPITRFMLPVVRGIIIATMVLIVIGAISFNPFALEWEKAEPTTIRLLQLLLIMIVGMPLLALMTPLRLQRGIEQTFGWLTKLRIPIYSFSLLVTLVFRFIPLLLKEWGRFAKLIQARGKVVSSGSAIPAGMLRFLLVPYIRSILRLAESMADALEARGYGNVTKKSTLGFRLSFLTQDAIVLTAAVVAFLLLLLISGQI